METSKTHKGSELNRLTKAFQRQARRKGWKQTRAKAKSLARIFAGRGTWRFGADENGNSIDLAPWLGEVEGWTPHPMARYYPQP
jgi:hypothetical protein